MKEDVLAWLRERLTDDAAAIVIEPRLIVDQDGGVIWWGNAHQPDPARRPKYDVTTGWITFNKDERPTGLMTSDQVAEKVVRDGAHFEPVAASEGRIRDVFAAIYRRILG